MWDTFWNEWLVLPEKLLEKYTDFSLPEWWSPMFTRGAAILLALFIFYELYSRWRKWRQRRQWRKVLEPSRPRKQITHHLPQGIDKPQ